MSNSAGDGQSSRFLFPDRADFLTPVGLAINDDFLAEEERCVRRLADAARMSPADAATVRATAARLLEAKRKRARRSRSITHVTAALQRLQTPSKRITGPSAGLRASGVILGLRPWTPA